MNPLLLLAFLVGTCFGLILGEVPPKLLLFLLCVFGPLLLLLL